jgi:hypothetical protein
MRSMQNLACGGADRKAEPGVSTWVGKSVVGCLAQAQRSYRYSELLWMRGCWCTSI